MSTTRERILQTILNRQRCTINELANVVEINPISVRHHIIKLQAEELVDSEEERHGVGRPRRVYFLTEAGLERFPTRYLRITNRLLDQMKDVLPNSTLDKIFTQVGEGLASDFTGEVDLRSLNMEDRLDLLTELLLDEGFIVEWERKGDEIHIKEMNCPYYKIGQNHPEVCTIDQTLISNVLSVPATKIRCILDGDSFCTYVVPMIPTSDLEVLEGRT